jgi:predicted amidohydrolase
MKVCIAEFPDEQSRYAKAIESIAQHASNTNPDLLVLPEMPFTPWIFLFAEYSEEKWQHTVENHAHWLTRLSNSIPTPIVHRWTNHRLGR